jgi:thioredoxin reductase
MIYDAIVLGAGPVGLYMCKLLEENNKSYLLMENFHNVGGQCQNIYPNKCMYDIPGLGAITGGEFVEFLLSYINKKNIRLGETCISHNKQEDIFQIVTNIEWESAYLINLILKV